jgi:hypothetical protein
LNNKTKLGKNQNNAVDKPTTASTIVLNVGLGMLKNDGTTKSSRIDTMTFGRYKPGCLCLGYVLTITDKHIVVSLTGGLTGIVLYHEISDVTYRNITTLKSSPGKKNPKNLPSIQSLIQPMQQVRCYVLEPTEEDNEKKRKSISLSIVVNFYFRY